ncbi:uncharacterized protein [Chelonus insularis]|uniref:uncharacterized protein n=1 Tax=Chelonus insularis TaxID=460826 RepID=UPI00158EA003|nr:uncharacterized protein LOC118064860 [Chelonus insularis]
MSSIKNMEAAQEFTDALNHCIDLLRQNNYITNSNNDVISRRAAVFGQYMYEYLMQCRFVWMYQRPENQLQEVPVEISNETDSIQSTTEHELSGAAATNSEIDQLLSNTEINSSNSNGFYYTIKIDQLPMANCNDEKKDVVNERAVVPFVKSVELIRDGNSCQSSPETSINLTPRMTPKPLTRKRYSMSSRNSSKATEDLNKTNDDNNNSHNNHESLLNESQKRSGKKKVVSLEEKQKVVELAQANPTWSLELLQKHGSPKLQTLAQLRTWQRQINKGASTRDSFQMIERWTYANYADAVKHQRRITKKMVRDWAIQAGTLFLDSKGKQAFKASGLWVTTFIKKYNVQISGKRNKKAVKSEEE